MIVMCRRWYTGSVKDRILDHSWLRLRLKCLVADMFREDTLEPGKIVDEEPLTGDSFCLDSLDAVELAICVEEEFGITIRSGEESHNVFTNIASLAGFIRARMQTSPVRPYSPAAAWIALAGLRAVADGGRQ